MDRKSIRLKDYDYSQPGLYFITICIFNRELILGKIVDQGLESAEMRLSQEGIAVEKTWNQLTEHIKHIKLHEFIIMPNHIHGIIEILDDPEEGANSAGTNFVGTNFVGTNFVRAIQESPQRKMPQPTTPQQMNIKQRRKMKLSKIIGKFKMLSAKSINIIRENGGGAVWQRNYYEHIIKDEDSYRKISEYIKNNPILWDKDDLYV